MEPGNILLWLAGTLTTVGLSVRASQWFRNSQTCYYLHNVTQSFDDASATCWSLQSRLVELETVSEFMLVTDYISSVGEVWVNLKRTNLTDPLYSWSNEASVNSSMWIPGEPNLSGVCVRLVKNYPTRTYLRHYLADVSCGSLYLAMCERPYVPTRTSSTRAGSSELAGTLCQLFQMSSLSLLRCAQACTAVTKCLVYGFDKRAKLCSLFELSSSCAQTLVLSSGVTYYNVTRYCY